LIDRDGDCIRRQPVKLAVDDCPGFGLGTFAVASAENVSGVRIEVKGLAAEFACLGVHRSVPCVWVFHIHTFIVDICVYIIKTHPSIFFEDVSVYNGKVAQPTS